MREGRAEPATSVRGATHIQLVSRATRDQTDPLAPAGRRFGNFVFGARTIDHAAAAGRALGVRGIAKQAALKDQRYRAPSTLLARISHVRVRAAPSQRRPSADRPARAGWAALRQFLFRQFFLEIFPATLVSRATRNRTDPLAPPAGRRRHFLNSGWGLVRPPRRRIAVWSWPGGAGRAQRGTGSTSIPPDRNSTALAALALARATGGSERSAEKGRRLPYWRAFPACACEAEPSDALRQQTDPLEPAGRVAFVWARIDLAAAGRALDLAITGNKATANQSPLLRLCL